MFDKLTEYLDLLEAPSSDLLVMKDHQVIYRHLTGYADVEKRVPLSGKETYNLYSCSKVITGCAAMQLFEKGLIHPDDPVSEILPAFKDMKVLEGDRIRPARTEMTLRHLLSMQSGMDYNLTSPSILAENKARNGMASTRQLVDAMAKEPLHFDPGTDFCYSLSLDVIAAVIEEVTGMKYSDYLKKNIFEPIGMQHTGFELTEETRSLQCAQYRFDENTGNMIPIGKEDMEYRLSPCFESGGAGLIGTTEDMAALADAVACNETKAGCRFLQPETIDLWRKPQLCKKAKETFDNWNRIGYDYAFGVRTRTDTTVGRKGPLGEFGWDGAAASYLMIDPGSHLSCFMAMHVRYWNKAYDVIHPTVQSLIYEGLSER